MRFLFLTTAAIVALASQTLSAHEYTSGAIFVHHPAVNATPPGSTTAIGYFEIKNNGDLDDELISIDAPALAAKAQLHSMTINDGVTEMRDLKSLIIPPQTEVRLNAMGTHIMFTGLKAPIKEGDQFPAVLHFRNAGDVNVYFAGEPIGTDPSHGDHAEHEAHGDAVKPDHSGH